MSKSKSKSKGKGRRKSRCKRKYTLKYTKRNSPPYQANSSGCRGKIKKGNDGNRWKSVSMMRSGKQIYLWRKLIKRN